MKTLTPIIMGIILITGIFSIFSTTPTALGQEHNSFNMSTSSNSTDCDVNTSAAMVDNCDVNTSAAMGIASGPVSSNSTKC